MISNKMADESGAFGLETGLFQSFYEEKDFVNNKAKKFIDVTEQEDDAFFPELELSEDVPEPCWSLLEQLEASYNSSSSLEDIFDNALSPLSSTSNETNFIESCLPSPISDSGDSGISSCPSPFSASDHLEELTNNNMAWEPDHLMKDMDWSAFNFLPNVPEVVSSETEEMSEPGCDNQAADVVPFSKKNVVDSMLADLVAGFGPSIMGETVVPVSQDIMPLIEQEVTSETMEVTNIEAEVISPSSESLETNEVPFIEEEKMSPAVVQEGPKCQPIKAYRPIRIMQVPPETIKTNQKIFIVKAEPVRSEPYPKKNPKKRKTPEQKARKKNQNRDAALRYRSKKKDELQELFDEATKLEETNKGLSDKVSSLTTEIDYLKSLMLDVIKAKLSRSNSQQSES